jgi:arylsulfatase A-like enzyme
MLNHKPPDIEPSRLWTWITFGLWAGIVIGMVEGAGLLLFQRINWQRWGPMVHVSAPILWISPIVDTSLFVLVALIAWLIARSIGRNVQLRVLVFLLTYLAVYDWLTLTGRLYHLACIFLAAGVAFASSRWAATHEEKVVNLVRRSLPAVAAVLLLAFVVIEGQTWWAERSATAALPPSRPGAPNVLVVVIDTLRADHVSAYGYSRPTTPNIDDLAKEGVLFENAIAPSSWSLPSHVSLVTGRYLHEHKVGNVQPEPWLGWGNSGLGGLPTIGEALQKIGYRTGAFSANRTYFSKGLGFGRGFIHFEDYFNSPEDAFVRTVYGREFARIYLKRSNKSLVKRVLRWLGWRSLLDQDAEGSGSYGGAFGIRKHSDEVNREVQHWIDRDQQHPFFAVLNYFDVHDPYGGPSTYPRPAWAQESDIDRYDDGVKYVDDCFGELTKFLRQKELLANTLVIVTSDHGESLGQHHLMTHGRALYWELIHVPLILWYPGHLPAGTTIGRPVSNAEIPATIMDILGSTPNSSPEPGLSPESPSLLHEGAPEAISELGQNRYPGKHDEQADTLIPTASSGSMETIVNPDWQLIWHTKLGLQLYARLKDPQEDADLIGTPRGQAEAASLHEELKKLTRK